jgi:thioredoxin reductase (NADPH)
VIADCAGERETVPAKALFIFIGAVPHTEWLGDVVQRDSQGFILSGPDLQRDQTGSLPGWTLDRDPFLLETSVPGVFVAGDVRYHSIKRVASGVGEGSIAVQFIHQYLSKV